MSQAVRGAWSKVGGSLEAGKLSCGLHWTFSHLSVLQNEAQKLPDTLFLGTQLNSGRQGGLQMFNGGSKSISVARGKLHSRSVSKWFAWPQEALGTGLVRKAHSLVNLESPKACDD